MGKLVFHRTDTPEQEILARHREPAAPDIVLSAYCPRLHLGAYGLDRHDVLWLDEMILGGEELRTRRETAGKRLCRCGEIVHLV